MKLIREEWEEENIITFLQEKLKQWHLRHFPGECIICEQRTSHELEAGKETEPR